MKTSELGRHGEDLAAAEYESRGYAIIGRNVRVHSIKQIGEIDLVAVRKNEIVFIEVKTRRSKAFGSGTESVSYLKQRKLIRAAKLFLLRHPQYDTWNWRLDVAEVGIDKTKNNIIILENAIEDMN